ncbi:MAG TPA: VOC family protein [Thermomicrobiales bacterium]|jgi:catechol 2,3-dioxygenase-like lactoylglutathione lyase family enzyme
MAVHLDAISITVEDMARSLAFYRRLGLDLPPERDREPHVETALPSGLRVLWDTEESLKQVVPGFQPPVPGGQRIGLAFLAGSPAEVDALYDELISLGHKGEHAPWDAIWGQRYAIVRDPDGNEVALFAPLS